MLVTVCKLSMCFFRFDEGLCYMLNNHLYDCDLIYVSKPEIVGTNITRTKINKKRKFN